MSLIESVRERCRDVAGRARFVHIERDRIAAYARSLPLDQAVCPEHDPHTHCLGRGDMTAAFFVTLDAINFGSGYFPHLRKRPGLSGYYTVAASLNDLFRAQGPLTPEQLVRLTAQDCAGIFGQDLSDPAILELMALFAQALRDLGCLLLDRYHGRFMDLIEAAGQSAEEMVRLLTAMPYFRDVEPYDGLEVPFYKRAQLTAADLALAFGGEGPGRFTDLDRLTIFADNLVPHVLRVDRLLTYDADLASRIDLEQLIPAGSPEEVEIRACAVHTVELLVQELRAAGQPVTSQQLDYILWNRGHDPYYKKILPRHRTRTVYY